MKVVIFDYDGVIIDSFANVFEVYKIIGKEKVKQNPLINNPSDILKTVKKFG